MRSGTVSRTRESEENRVCEVPKVSTNASCRTEITWCRLKWEAPIRSTISGLNAVRRQEAGITRILRIAVEQYLAIKGGVGDEYRRSPKGRYHRLDAVH